MKIVGIDQGPVDIEEDAGSKVGGHAGGSTSRLAAACSSPVVRPEFVLLSTDPGPLTGSSAAFWPASSCSRQSPEPATPV